MRAVDVDRRRALLGLGAGLATWLSPASAAAPVAARDDFGDRIALPAPAARVIALGHIGYAQLAALGLRPVGAFANPAFSAMQDYLFPDPALIPSVVHADWSPEPEIVALTKPDLILGYADRNLRQLRLLAPVFVLDEHTTIDAMVDNLRRVGVLTGRSEAAETAIARLDARLGAVRERAAAVARPKVLWINPLGAEITLPGRDHLTHRLLATFCDVAAPPGSGWTPASPEALLALDPDAALLANWDGEPEEALLARLSADPVWSRLRALRDGRLRTYPGYQDLSVRGVPTAVRLLDLAPGRLLDQPGPTR